MRIDMNHHTQLGTSVCSFEKNLHPCHVSPGSSDIVSPLHLKLSRKKRQAIRTIALYIPSQLSLSLSLPEDYCQKQGELHISVHSSVGVRMLE